MRALVTGSRGQLALSLAAIARQQGVDLALVGRPALDVTRQASVADCITRTEPDIVVNAAAFTDVDAAERDPVVCRAVNADGAANVANACARAGIPVIHISTDYVFDGGKPSAYAEGDDTAPVNTYGRTKRDGEVRVAEACSRHLILRTAWLYSPSGSNFARTILRLASEQATISVVDDQFGSPTYAPHLAHVVLAAASRVLKRPDASLWGTYHAAGTGSASRSGFAELLLVHSAVRGGPTASVRPVGTAAYPTRAKRPSNSRLDCSKLERVFGLALPRWESGVRDCVERLFERSGEGAGRPVT